MRYSKYVLLLALTFILSSCYHAQITTDKAASSQVIDKPWASSFVFGLVPPKVVETASECPNGLAKVETKQSFLNGLVSGLTFSLYTPMHIKVTCAASGTASLNAGNNSEIIISKNFNEKEKTEALQRASAKSIETGKAVYVNVK